MNGFIQYKGRYLQCLLLVFALNFYSVFTVYAGQTEADLIRQWEATYPRPQAALQLPSGVSDDEIFDIINNYELNCASFPCEADELNCTPVTDDGTTCTYHIGITMAASEPLLKEARADLSAAAVKMADRVRGSTPDGSPRERLYAAFQAISANASYDEGLASLSGTGRLGGLLPLNRTAYGALVTGKTVCTGYARALKGVCGQLGLPCWVIAGTKDGEPHSWNAVCLDGATYYIDCTAASVGETDPNPFLFNKETAKQYHYLPASYSIPPWESDQPIS